MLVIMSEPSTAHSSTFLGNYVNGHFEGTVDASASASPFRSENPATLETVCDAIGDPDAVARAVNAAHDAWPAWRRLTVAERAAALQRVAAAVPEHAPAIAAAITAEMGKVHSEALIEAKSVAQKLQDTIALYPHELSGAMSGAPGEQRHRPLGVVAIIGPFNFPVHLINTHLLPALLAGNTVVAKVSELTPLTGQRYAALFHAAGLPPGVFNLVQGGGPVGQALVTHPSVHGVIFTGSYNTARRIRQALFDMPEKKLALELGGKNPVVVLDDVAEDPARLDHAVREILLGALLTAGQRCTATSRVIATPGVAPALRERLTTAFRTIRPGDPDSPDTFLGPLASQTATRHFLRGLDAAKADGARVLVDSEHLGACFVTPSLYEVAGHESLVHEELFGPNVAFELATDPADAFRRASNSRFGLSASIFTESKDAFEAFVDAVPTGVVNWNRSTNGASGLLPFGGIGMSGNFSPGGSGSLRIGTYPVAVMQIPSTQRTPNAALDAALRAAPPETPL